MRAYLKYLASGFLGMAIMCFMVTVFSVQLSGWNHWIFLLAAFLIAVFAMDPRENE